LSADEISERAEDPSALTRFAYAHPWRLGLTSGAVIAGWALVLGLVWPVALAVGAVLAIGQGFAWRPGLRSYLLFRFPRNERS
jgi:hypothetical protein